MNLNAFLLLSIIALAVPSPRVYGAGDPAAGRDKFSACVSCHRQAPDASVDTQGPVPKLAGQHGDYVRSALDAYAEGDRTHAGMKAIAAALTKQDRDDIAAYIAELQPKTQTIPEAGTASPLEHKIENCRSCHGERGNSAVPYNPKLIGQDEAYLLKALRDYRSGQRKDLTMGYIVKKLADRDLQEMASYYAAQQNGLAHTE